MQNQRGVSNQNILKLDNVLFLFFHKKYRMWLQRGKFGLNFSRGSEKIVSTIKVFLIGFFSMRI